MNFAWHAQMWPKIVGRAVIGLNFRAFKSPTAKHTRATERKRNIPAAINFTSARATHFSRAPVTPLSKIPMHNEKPSVITPALLSVAHENRFITCAAWNLMRPRVQARLANGTRREKEKGKWWWCLLWCRLLGPSLAHSLVRGRNFRFSSLSASTCPLGVGKKKRAANLLHTNGARNRESLICFAKISKRVFLCRRRVVLIFCAAKNSWALYYCAGNSH